MEAKSQTEHDIGWVVRRLRNDSLIFGSSTFEYRFSESDPVTSRQQRKILQKLAEDGVIAIRPLLTQMEGLASSIGNASRWDAEVYRITLHSPVFEDIYKLHSQNSAEVVFKNSTIRQGLSVHSFSRNSDGADIVKQLWQHRQSKKTSGQLNYEGSSLSAEILQVNLGDKFSKETISSQIDSINRVFRNKGINAKIKKGRTIQLIVTEDYSSSKKQYSN